MDFPIVELHGRGRLLPQARRPAPPRRAWPARAAASADHSGPPPPPRPGARLPLHGLRPRLQRLHRHRPGTGTHRTPAEVMLILRGFAQGVPTAPAGPRAGLRPQAPAGAAAPAPGQRLAVAATATRWATTEVEADEMYQNAGEKRRRAPRPGRPAPAAGQQAAGATAPWPTTGRRWPGWSAATSGAVRLEVVDSAGSEELDEVVAASRRGRGATVNTDEWAGTTGGWPARAAVHGRWTTRAERVRAGRRRGRGARGALQHAGGDLDGAAELPAAVPGGEQGVPGAVRGDVRVVVQPQGRDLRLHPRPARGQGQVHQMPYMSPCFGETGPTGERAVYWPQGPQIAIGFVP